jgi:hypothetical protein
MPKYIFIHILTYYLGLITILFEDYFQMTEQAALEHKEIGPILAAQHTKMDLPTIITTTTTTTHDETESANTSDLPDTHYTSYTNESNNDTDSDTNINTNDTMDPINTNTPTTTTTTTTTITTTATTKQHEEVPSPTLESILSELTDLPPVHKVAKKRKIIDDDNIDSGKEDEERRKPKERTKGGEKMGHWEREVIVLDDQMDEKVEEAELDDMDNIDVEKELVTINEDPNKLPEFNCMCTFSFNVNCYNF